MPILVVDEHGTELSYIDSGVPNGTKDYVTIFAIHGTVFTSRELRIPSYISSEADAVYCLPAIWDRVIALAPKSGVRFVAVNRRDYPGSTALSPEDINVLNSGTDDQKADYLKARGVEFATFVNLFAEKNNIPPISPDGTAGGFGLVGWSLGCAFVLAAVAAVDALPAPAQARWKAGARALILQGVYDNPHLFVSLLIFMLPQSLPPSLSARPFRLMRGRRSSTRACPPRSARPFSRTGSRR